MQELDLSTLEQYLTSLRNESVKRLKGILENSDEEQLPDDSNSLDYIDILDGLRLQKKKRKRAPISRLDELRQKITDQRRKILKLERQVSRGKRKMNSEEWDSEYQFSIDLVHEFATELNKMVKKQEKETTKLGKVHRPKYRYTSKIEPIHFRRIEKDLQKTTIFNVDYIRSFVHGRFSKTELMELASKLDKLNIIQLGTLIDARSNETVCTFEENDTEEMKKFKILEEILEMIDPMKVIVLGFTKQWPHEFTEEEERILELFTSEDPIDWELLDKEPIIKLSVERMNQFAIKMRIIVEKIENLVSMKQIKVLIGVLYPETLFAHSYMSTLTEDNEKETLRLIEKTVTRIRDTENLFDFLLEPDVSEFLPAEMKTFVSLCVLDWTPTTQGPWKMPLVKEINWMLDRMEKRMAEEEFNPYGEYPKSERIGMREHAFQENTLLLNGLHQYANRPKFVNPLYRAHYHKQFKYLFANREWILDDVDVWEEDAVRQIEENVREALEEISIEKSMTEDYSYAKNILNKLVNSEVKRKTEIDEIEIIEKYRNSKDKTTVEMFDDVMKSFDKILTKKEY